MMSNVISMVVAKRKNKPMKKIMSAKFSNLLLAVMLRLIEINERMQLVMNMRIAPAVISSM